MLMRNAFKQFSYTSIVALFKNFLVTVLTCLICSPHISLGKAVLNRHSSCEKSDGTLNGIPDVLLFDQDGRKVRFYSDLVKNKTVIISFIFTSCTASCPRVGANYARIQTLLNDRPGKDIRLISITIDPETDTPARLKAWAAQFGVNPNWTLVTGAKTDIDSLTVSLTGGVIRKGVHTPEVIVGDEAHGIWTHTYALDTPSSILDETENHRDGHLYLPIIVAPTLQAMEPSKIGQWSDVPKWESEIVAVHMTLLPDGKVLIWPRYEPISDDIPVGDRGSQTPHARVWDPKTDSFTEIPNPYTNLFCCGHALLPDGRVFVNGGHFRNADGAGDLGVCDANFFNWNGATGSWSKGADMNYERWYSTVLPLANGDVLAIGGSYGGTHDDRLPNQPLEVWQRGGWTGFQQLVGKPTNLATQLDAVRMPDGHVEVFMVGRDGRMWRTSQHSDGTFPDDFAMKPVGSPANMALRISVVPLPDGRADVYMVGLDGNMWHSVQRPDGSFPDFAEARVGSPSNIAIDIAAIRMSDGHIEVFMVGIDGRMWRSPQRADGTFPDFAERPVGVPANKALRISVVPLPNNRADVYMVGLDGNMWHSVQQNDGSFPDFARARVGSPSNIATEIKAVRLPDAHIEVFMVGLYNLMWRSVQRSDGTFPDFAERPIAWCPQNKAIRIAVAPFPDGRHDIYMVRQDQTIWRSYETTDYGWRELTGIGRTTNNDTGWYMYYPWAYVAPNGKVFVAGPTKKTFWIDVSGNGSIQPGPVGNMFRDYGSSVMYDYGKILNLGGGTTNQRQAEASAQIIDLNAPIPKWSDTNPMSFPRKQANATILPNGQVLVVGGTKVGGPPDLSYEANNNFVLNAELWDPATGKWSPMASMKTPRTYHSTAILLPTGKVLVAGGGQGGGLPAHPNAEIYSPPYLFQGKRPVIISVPEPIRYNKQFDVVATNARDIASVTLVRLGSATHAYNQNQRFIRLSFTRRRYGGKITVTAPLNGNVCPPGHYMLFILNRNNVPSEAKIVRLSS